VTDELEEMWLLTKQWGRNGGTFSQLATTLFHTRDGVRNIAHRFEGIEEKRTRPIVTMFDALLHAYHMFGIAKAATGLTQVVNVLSTRWKVRRQFHFKICEAEFQGQFFTPRGMRINEQLKAKGGNVWVEQTCAGG